MDMALLRKHIANYVADSRAQRERFEKDLRERAELVVRNRQFTRQKLLSMSDADLYGYLSPLWAMLLWGNKHYVVDKIIKDNGLKCVLDELAALLWGEQDIAPRWDGFRKSVKGIGPAMMSELLCKTHPDDFMLWNRRAWVGLNYLKVTDLPRHDYQVTGTVYKRLCSVSGEIARELADAGVKDTSHLAVDYFIWEQLQVAENLSALFGPEATKAAEVQVATPGELQFVHDDVRDKLQDIGHWLGFAAKTEQLVSKGSKVDAVWEAMIGNMGRVIYVFEVQTRGSIDSLILNLLKSLKNPAVQGVVAVSDRVQLETIRGHAEDVKELRDKLRYWDYREVLQVHESMEFVNSSINKLGLVPEGF
jgi:hypothetical protein